jgi:hypothetical protein
MKLVRTSEGLTATPGQGGEGGQQSIHPMQPDDDRSKLIEMGGVWEAMKHQFVRKA